MSVVMDERFASLLLHYPVLDTLHARERQLLGETVLWLSLPEGTVVFDERQTCTGFPLLVAGSIRVLKTGPTGREITLYRVEPGDSCVITSSCLLSGIDYHARGVADEPVSLALVPANVFSRLIETTEFRRFVFGVFGQRLSSLMQLVEEVAFRKLDQRLATVLLQHGPVLHATHQSLADELGSVREIVSRLLRDFARQGWVELEREKVSVVDSNALRRHAQRLS
jgi:CRP/FNR family transcriptional regulator, anaerobic regulatory protein